MTRSKNQLFISSLLVAKKSNLLFHDFCVLFLLYFFLANMEQKDNVSVQHWILHEGEGRRRALHKDWILWNLWTY